METASTSTQFWDFPLPIHAGPSVRQSLAERCKTLGITAPLVVTDRSTVSLPFVAGIVETLSANNLRPTLFSEVSSNPTDSNVLAGIDAFTASESDAVIALGGGSGMDCGKAISFVTSLGGDRIWDFDFANPSPPEQNPARIIPVICIPTTAGTGAETDMGSIITDTVEGVKRCIFPAHQRPAMALLDPELTLGLPPNLTAWTGADALVHAIEAYVVPEFHPICDGIALQAMELVSGSILQAVRHGDDLEARANMLYGSCMAGISFTKGLGLVHSISHMIGAVYDTHHGLTNAVMLPAVLNFNRPAIESKIPAMCRALGLKADGYADFYRAVVQLLDDLEIPGSLAELGVREEDIGGLATKTMTDICLPTNPRPVELADVERLLYAAMERVR